MSALDPFVAPPASHRVADAPFRSPVVLWGIVLDRRVATWVGGSVLEVTFSDGTGGVCLAFLGRRRLAGLEVGRMLTVAGTTGSRHGGAVMVNPQYWLHAPVPEVGHA